MLQKNLIDVAIPHQSQIGFEEPICDSFPPGEAFGSCLNCKINYNLHAIDSQPRIHRGFFFVLIKLTINYLSLDKNKYRFYNELEIHGRRRFLRISTP